MATVNEKMTAIADAIREKTGGTKKFGLDDMAEGVNEVYDKGKTDGYSEGETAGYQKGMEEIYDAQNKLSWRIRSELLEGSLDYYIDEAINDFDNIEAEIEAQGVDVVDNNTYTMANAVTVACEHNRAKGIEEGKQAQYDEFWDKYQNKGTIYSAQYMFAGPGWNDETFKPKYSLWNISNAANMFNMCKITDLRSILKEQGVSFSFKNCTGFGNMIAYSSITHFPDVVTTKASALTSFLNQAYNLVSMGLVTLKDDGTQTFDSAFYNCTKLQDISFAGTIGNNIDMHWSPLSKDSITSVVNALSSTATGKTLTLTLKKTAVNNAFGINVDDETTYPEGSEFYELRHSKDNWTFSYVEGETI